MLAIISQNWRMHVLRGILAVIFGLMALLWPGLTIGVLVIFFGVYVLLEGILAITAAVRHRTRRWWWLLLVEGVAGIVVGIFAFIWPGLTAVVLLIFIAVWAILTGIFEIGAAVQLRKELKGEWVLGIAGIISILIGVFLIANPGAGALAVVWLIGIYALIFGVLLIALGLKVRKHVRKSP
ncbi:MAG: HdeD family acid-resistance protein [Deltaproteobacteria bacterium]|nr:HdeD family acid-resistance protein [Deltaproteobacteria bacterium]